MSAATLVITGANRGVGLGIVNLISSQPTAYTVYITSRSGSDLPNPSCKSTFLPRKLDISDPASVKSLAAEVKKSHPDGIDAIINNAGVNLNPEGYSEETIKNTLKINYYGTKAMCDNFIPLVKKGGRIVNVASVGGHLNGYSAEAKKRIQSGASSTSALKDLVSEYETLVENKQEAEAGFKKDAYCVSKAFVVALTKGLAAENTGLQINCCCPGWVDTDMGLQMGKPPKSLEDGGRIPLRLAVGDIGDSTGEFWENDSIASTADGKVSVW